MYLHIGQDMVVRDDDVLGIFDIDNTSVSALTREYLAAAQEKGEIVNVTDELPKSFIVCAGGKRDENGAGQKVYISQISASTLLRRAGDAGERA
jgi:extracellular matrix regulatory protein B